MRTPTRPETPHDGTDEAGTARVPDDVTSPRGKLVHLYLVTQGAATEEHLRTGLGLKRLSPYSTLKTLRAAGHVEETDGRYALA